MRIIDLAINDLLQILKDWKAALFLVIMPIGFTLMFGFIFSSGSSENDGEVDPRIPISFVDQDKDMLSIPLYDLLSMSDVIRPEYPIDGQTLEEIHTRLNDGDIAAVIVIPKGYTNALRNGENPQLDVSINTENGAGSTAQWSIQGAVSRLVSAIESAKFSVDARKQFQPFNSQVEEDGYLESSLEKAIDSWRNPPISLVESQTGQEASESEEDEVYSENSFAHSSVGMMVQFAIAGLIGASEIIVFERQSGSLKRLLTTSIKRTDILFGHFLAMFIMIFVQFVTLIIFGQLILNVPYFNSPIGTLLMALTTTFFTASLGLLIGTLAKTPEQTIIFSLIPMFILSGLGGAWMPLEFTSESFQRIAHFTPVAWAMDGFNNIIVRGQGLQSVLLPAVILIGFAVVLFGLSAWRFNCEEI